MPPSELDLAQLKHEMRQMYRNIGFTASIRVVSELLISARVLAEVILEEQQEPK